MSFFYDPELVRSLTAARLADAQEAGRGRDSAGRNAPSFSRLFDRIAGYARRTTGPRSAPAACTCQ
jgi:hypothetical protein